MGSMKVVIKDDVEQRFRRAAMRKYGYGRGALSEAAEAALDEWSGREYGNDAPPSELEKDPVGAIEGLLSSVRSSSIELQHGASKIRVKKVHAKSTRRR